MAEYPVAIIRKDPKIFPKATRAIKIGALKVPLNLRKIVSIVAVAHPPHAPPPQAWGGKQGGAAPLLRRLILTRTLRSCRAVPTPLTRRTGRRIFSHTFGDKELVMALASSGANLLPGLRRRPAFVGGDATNKCIATNACSAIKDAFDKSVED